MRGKPIILDIKDPNYIDSLTSLYNRRFFVEHVKSSLVQLMAEGHPFTLILIDIDDFEYYNQLNGFEMGDQVLQQIGLLLEHHIRNSDFLIRYDGDTFLLVVTEISNQEAFIVAERLRKMVEEYHFPNETLQPQARLTISVGLASFPQDGDSFDFLVKRADTALFHAKERLKNRVEVFSF